MKANDTRVIPSFIRRIKTGQPIQIMGKGEATRTFCYVDDFIEGMMRAMFHDNTNGEVFNLGTEELVTINELAKLLEAKVEYVPARAAEQQNRKPDISKAKRILDWEPKTSLKEGLELMWKSYP
jgi:nucleoside-diphosphate-sugar epimerase